MKSTNLKTVEGLILKKENLNLEIKDCEAEALDWFVINYPLNIGEIKLNNIKSVKIINSKINVDNFGHFILENKSTLNEIYLQNI